MGSILNWQNRERRGEESEEKRREEEDGVEQESGVGSVKVLLHEIFL